MKLVLEAMSDLVAALVTLEGNTLSEGICVTSTTQDNDQVDLWGRFENNEIVIDVEFASLTAEVHVNLTKARKGKVTFTDSDWDKLDGNLPTWEQLGGGGE